MPHRIAHRLRQQPARGGWIRLRFGRAPGKCLGDIVVGLRHLRSCSVDKQGRAGRQGTDVTPDGERFGHAAEQVEADDAGRLGIARHSAAGQQCLGLRGEAQRPAVIRPVERLDAQRIAREQQGPLLGIPQAEGEHATQLGNHVGAAVGIELQHHLGVGIAAEAIAARHQFVAQFPVIIDLAVEGNGVTPASAVHRLRAIGAEVDDGEPLVGKTGPAPCRQPQAAAVGTARRHAVVDPRELGPVNRRRNVEIGVDAGYSAHDRYERVPRGRGCAAISGRRCRGRRRQPYARGSRGQATASSA